MNCAFTSLHLYDKLLFGNVHTLEEIILGRRLQVDNIKMVEGRHALLSSIFGFGDNGAGFPLVLSMRLAGRGRVFHAADRLVLSLSHHLTPLLHPSRVQRGAGHSNPRPV